jgi:hypothetical protein
MKHAQNARSPNLRTGDTSSKVAAGCCCACRASTLGTTRPAAAAAAHFCLARARSARTRARPHAGRRDRISTRVHACTRPACSTAEHTGPGSHLCSRLVVRACAGRALRPTPRIAAGTKADTGPRAQKAAQHATTLRRPRDLIMASFSFSGFVRGGRTSKAKCSWDDAPRSCPRL